MNTETQFCKACRNWFDLDEDQSQALDDFGAEVTSGEMRAEEAITAVHGCTKRYNVPAYKIMEYYPAGN